MLIERRALDKILAPQEVRQPSSSTTAMASSRSVAPATPDEVIRLSRIVMQTSSRGPLRLDERTVEETPETLPKLQQHPIVRVAYLESLLHDMAQHNSVSPLAFQAALQAEGLTPGSGSVFSERDKITVIDYLKNVTLPACKLKLHGSSSELMQVEVVLRAQKNQFLDHHDLEQQFSHKEPSEQGSPDGNASYYEQTYRSVIEYEPMAPDQDQDSQAFTTEQEDLLRLLRQSPLKFKNCPPLSDRECVIVVRAKLVKKDDLLVNPEFTMRALKEFFHPKLVSTSSVTAGASVTDDPVFDISIAGPVFTPITAPTPVPISAQPAPIATPVSRPIPAPRRKLQKAPETFSAINIKKHLLRAFKESIALENVEYIQKTLPNTDWGSERLLKELAFFNCCNRYGAGLSIKQFARMHMEGMFTDEMLATVGQPRSVVIGQEMQIYAVQLRRAVHTPPKPMPRRRQGAVADAKEELKKIDIPEEDSNILIAEIKRITRTILDALRALYQAMARTGVKFTAQECALLIINNMVDANALDDHSRQKEALEQLRLTLASIRESLRMPTEHHEQDSLDDTLVDSDRTVTYESDAEDLSDGEVSDANTEETDLEDTDSEQELDWVDTFYNYFSARRDNSARPLVATKEECRLLFTGLKSWYSKPQWLLDKLTYFRNMQFHQQAAQVSFTSRMFSTLVLAGKLNSDPTDIQMPADILVQMKAAGTEDPVVDARIQALRSLFSGLLSSDNYEPDNTGAERMQARGLEPAGGGLFNYSNNCFMNSTLQAVANSGAACGMLDTMRQGPSPQALYNMFDSIYDPQVKGETREEAVRRLAYRIQADPKNIYAEDMPPKAVLALTACHNLHKHFLALCDGLNNGPATLVQEQKAFIEAYREYAEVRDKTNVAYLLNSLPGKKVVFGRIPQQDPEEFYTTLTEALGTDQDPRYGVGNADQFKLYCDNELVDTKTKPSQYISSRMAIPLIGNSLQSSVEGFGAEEAFDKENQPRWESERSLPPDVVQGENTTVTKRIVMTANNAPDQLTLMMKLFNNYDPDGNYLEQARYMRTEGQELLRNLNRWINIPMTLKIDPLAPTNGDNQQQVTVPYEVKSIVCHRGDSLNSGHYITLKFTDDNVIICDDDIVADVTTYAQFHGREPYESWLDFCEKERLTPYLINTVRIEQSH